MKKERGHKEKGKPFRLEGLPKENIFKVPDRYFEELPGIIQARVTEKPSAISWQALFTPANGWKVALATVVVALVLVFSGVFNRTGGTVDELLADVSLEDLLEYVEYSDISTDEILAELDLSEYKMEFLMGDDIKLIDDFEIENLDIIDLYEVYGIEEELF